MPIRGRGKNPQEGLADKLRGMEAELRLLTELAHGKSDNKHLGQQLSILGLYTHAPQQQVREAARTLALKIYVDGLESQDPHARAEFEKIIAANPRLKELFGAKAPDAGGIEDQQLRFFMQLTGVLSDAERNALALIEPLVSAKQDTTIVEPVRAQTHKARRALASAMSAETRGVIGSTVLPTLIPVLATSALVAVDLIAPGAGSALAAGGTAVGYDVGGYLQREAYGADAKFGNNRLEGIEVERELVRAFDVAVSPTAASSDRSTIVGELLRRAETIEGLLALRTPPGPGKVLEIELEGEAALKRFAAALVKGARSRDPETALANAQADLREKVDRTRLTEAPSRVPGPSPVATDEQLRDALDVMVRRHFAAMLGVSNRPLLEVLTVISQKYGIDAPPGAPPTTEKKLNEAEIRTIRAMMDEAPSLAEFASVLRVVQAGAASFSALFEGVANVSLPEGGTMSVPEMLKMMDGLGGRGDAATMDAVGKHLPRAVLYLTAAGGAALALTTPMGWLGLLGMVGTMLITRITGRRVGSYLQEQAAKQKVMSGVEHSRLPPTAHNVLLQRLGSLTTFLSGTASEVKKQLRDEASIIETLCQAQLACVPDPLMASFDVVSNIRGRLSELGKAFQSAATSDEPLGKIRAQVISAQARAFGPNVAYDVIFDLVRSQTVSEQPQGLTIYGHLKQQLIAEAGRLLERAEETGAVPTNFTLVRLCRQLVESRDGLPKHHKEVFDGIGGLDELAKSVIKHPHAQVDLDELRRVRNEGKAIQAELNQRFIAVAAIGEVKAKETAQDLLTLVWAQAYSTFGTVSESQREHAPSLSGVEVITVPNDDGLVNYVVKAKLPNGGTFEVTMDAFGAPSVESLQIRLGERMIAEMATNALARCLAPIEVEVPASAAKRAQISSGFPGIDPSAYDGGVFRVEVPIGRDTYALAMTADGFALFDTVERLPRDRASA